MPAINLSTAQDFRNLLASIVTRARKAKLNNSTPEYTVSIDPNSWVVGVDTDLSLYVDNILYSGFAVMAVYKATLVLGTNYSSPSFIYFLDANDVRLFEVRLALLPYQSYGFQVVIPPGSLRLALYVAQPQWSNISITPYF